MMKRAEIRRREVIAAVIGGAVAIMLAGGVAWAAIGDGGVIQGCYDSGGNVKVVSALPCPKGYTAFQWNQQGQPGRDGVNGTNGQDGVDGVSVVSTALTPGDADCPEGGSQFTAANGVTYACNGRSQPGSGLTGREVVTASGSGGCDGRNSFGFCNHYSGAVATASCPEGKVATGGVGSGTGGIPGFDDVASGPSADGWTASLPGGFIDAGNPPPNPHVSATAVCFDAG